MLWSVSFWIVAIFGDRFGAVLVVSKFPFLLKAEFGTNLESPRLEMPIDHSQYLLKQKRESWPRGGRVFLAGFHPKKQHVVRRAWLALLTKHLGVDT
jgi:hypothetical protein